MQTPAVKCEYIFTGTAYVLLQAAGKKEGFTVKKPVDHYSIIIHSPRRQTPIEFVLSFDSLLISKHTARSSWFPLMSLLSHLRSVRIRNKTKNNILLGSYRKSETL